MIDGKKIAVVLPAYNAEKTLTKTYLNIPKDIVDQIILVDDHSKDHTIKIAKELGLEYIVHAKNLGYGGNQKTCYKEALKRGADIIVMLHPDYQYPPGLVPAMASMISSGIFDVVLGSRVLSGYALKGGMPVYKYISNRALTFIENIFLGAKLSEYHTGFRAFSRQFLLEIPILENSDDFVFDNQILAQAVYFGYRIGEISAPSNYNKDCSSISFSRSVKYGLGVLFTIVKFVFAKTGIYKYRVFKAGGTKLDVLK
jgi:glycosyltransferase involved in cell wall biosynthesis